MTLSVFDAAREAPDADALVADGRTVSFAALAERAEVVVARLRVRGLASAPVVALRARTDQPTIEALHALIALGVPALLLHPRLTPSEERRIVEEARPAAVLEGTPDGLLIEDRRTEGGHGRPAGPNAWAAAAVSVAASDEARPLAVVYTSGTTGRPRGVELSRGAFVASARASAANLGWRPDDRWLLRLPVAHVGGLSVVTRCLLARRAVVLSDDAEPDNLLATIERERVTLLSLVPTLLSRLLDLEPPRPAPPTVRTVLLGGAAASPALLERAADRMWPVLTTYGLTEACSQVTTQPYGTVNRGELGAGPPLPGTEIRTGDDGEIHVRGPTLMTGYFPRGSSPDPRTPDGWLPTGDFGRIDDAGNLHVAGRRTDRIVTGGENVDPVEVEQALEAEPSVRQACVFGVPDEEWGEVVCAALVARPGDAMAAVRAVARSLAPFKRPRRVAILESLPMTASGKVDRAAAARVATPQLRPVGRPASD